MIYDDTVDLQFNDPKLDELEVTAREVSIEAWGRYCTLNAQDVHFDPTAVAGGSERLAEILEIVGGSLVSWNLQDRDAAGVLVSVPCDVAGLRSRPGRVVKAIVEAWRDAQIGLADPFAEPSMGGAPLAEHQKTALAS